MKTFSFPFYKQTSYMDCGPACLKTICLYYGKEISIEYLRTILNTSRNGTTMLSLSRGAEKLGFKTIAIKSPIERIHELPLPSIAHWKQQHFIVIYKISAKFVFVSDPAFGKIKYKKSEFIKNWSSQSKSISITDNGQDGILLILSATDKFLKNKFDDERFSSFEFIKKYISSEQKTYYYLFFLLLLLILLNITAPLLSQKLIDLGVLKKNIELIYVLTIGQILIVLGQAGKEFFRGLLLLKLGMRLNIKLISDFLKKLTKVHILFFESRIISDLLQRINDQTRLQNFITSSFFSIFSSIITLLIFGTILSFFNTNVLLIFIAGSLFSFIWSLLFLKPRKEIDYNRFTAISESQNKVLEILYGINDIKINCIEEDKRKEWLTNQNDILSLNQKLFKISQIQQIGNIVIGQIKNVVIMIIAYQAVISNQITLGTLYAITFIIGQLNNPIDILIKSISTFQEAKISLDRIKEIYSVKDEYSDNNIRDCCVFKNINIKILNISYKYGFEEENVLDNISFSIHNKQVTAITGKSGSGKSTLLKLLLKFYKPINGKIFIDGTNLFDINTSFWRNKCGTVLQDSFIFNDSIKNNIILNKKYDKNKFEEAISIVNLLDLIGSLPLKEETRIGTYGLNVSSGEKQRILIARAIYKNPELLIFDEATNNLDAENENYVLQNLFEYFKDKTVIMVAHRMSTIKFADNIVVLDKGKIKENGTHHNLLMKKGFYYNLTLNQSINM